MSSPSPLAASALVAIGGGGGAWLRYVTGRAIGSGALPWATLSVNVAGSFAMGLLAGWLARHGAPESGNAESWRLLLGVGLLGGFTTFSAFSLETMNLVRQGDGGRAAIYVVGSLVMCGVAVVSGAALGRGR